MKKISKELMGAFSKIFILGMLSKKDTYGYEIMETIKIQSEGKIVWKEGSLYPVLKNMENQKLIQSYWDLNKSPINRPRKYYKILPKGKKQFTELNNDLNTAVEMVKNISK